MITSVGEIWSVTLGKPWLCWKALGYLYDSDNSVNMDMWFDLW